MISTPIMIAIITFISIIFCIFIILLKTKQFEKQVNKNLQETKLNN